MKISPLLDKSRSFIMTSTTTSLSVGFVSGIITEEFQTKLRVDIDRIYRTSIIPVPCA